MIGQFFPAMVVAASGYILAPGRSVINGKAASAAAELASNVEWLEVQ